GTQAWEVTSPLPMSSANARFTMSAISAIQAILDFLQLSFVFGEFSADGVHDFGRGFAEEDVVGELPLRVCDVLQQLVAFFFETFPLGLKLAMRDIDHETEIRCPANGTGLRYFADCQVHPRQFLHDAEIDRARNTAFERHFRIEIEIGTQTTKGGDDALQQTDFGFGRGVITRRIELRIGTERNRRAVCIPHAAMPQLFGKERHERVEQAEGFVEDAEDAAPVAGNFLELDVPVAEIVVDEVPDGLRSRVVAVIRDGLIHLARALVEARPDPAVFEVGGRGVSFREVLAGIHEDEAGRVPDL